MTDRQTINIVFTVDNDHSMFAGIAIRSIVSEFEKSENRDRYSLGIYIIAVGINDQNKAALSECGMSCDFETRVSFLDYQLHKEEKGADRFAEIISIIYRLPELFPDLERAIALDSDVLITGDISKLWEIDLDGYWLSAVPCLIADDHVCLRNYNYPFQIKYDTSAQPINAGVLVMDLVKMRQMHVTETLVDWTAENADRTLLVNQEAIAMNFPEQWKVLPHEWNFRLFAEPYWTSSWSSFRCYAKLEPGIVHFQKGLRPHKMLATLPYFDEWITYCQTTPWRSQLKRKRMNYLMFVYFSYFRIFGWMNLRFRSQTAKLRVLSLIMLPFALPRYLLYCWRPLKYRFGIDAYVHPLSGSGEYRVNHRAMLPE